MSSDNDINLNVTLDQLINFRDNFLKKNDPSYGLYDNNKRILRDTTKENIEDNKKTKNFVVPPIVSTSDDYRDLLLPVGGLGADMLYNLRRNAVVREPGVINMQPYVPPQINEAPPPYTPRAQRRLPRRDLPTTSVATVPPTLVDDQEEQMDEPEENINEELPQEELSPEENTTVSLYNTNPSITDDHVAINSEGTLQAYTAPVENYNTQFPKYTPPLNNTLVDKLSGTKIDSFVKEIFYEALPIKNTKSNNQTNSSSTIPQIEEGIFQSLVLPIVHGMFNVGMEAFNGLTWVRDNIIGFEPIHALIGSYLIQLTASYIYARAVAVATRNYRNIVNDINIPLDLDLGAALAGPLLGGQPEPQPAPQNRYDYIFNEKFTPIDTITTYSNGKLKTHFTRDNHIAIHNAFLNTLLTYNRNRAQNAPHVPQIPQAPQAVAQIQQAIIAQIPQQAAVVQRTSYTQLVLKTLPFLLTYVTTNQIIPWINNNKKLIDDYTLKFLNTFLNNPEALMNSTNVNNSYEENNKAKSANGGEQVTTTTMDFVTNIDQSNIPANAFIDVGDKQYPTADVSEIGQTVYQQAEKVADTAIALTTGLSFINKDPVLPVAGLVSSVLSKVGLSSLGNYFKTKPVPSTIYLDVKKDYDINRFNRDVEQLSEYYSTHFDNFNLVNKDLTKFNELNTKYGNTYETPNIALTAIYADIKKNILKYYGEEKSFVVDKIENELPKQNLNIFEKTVYRNLLVNAKILNSVDDNIIKIPVESKTLLGKILTYVPGQSELETYEEKDFEDFKSPKDALEKITTLYNNYIKDKLSGSPIDINLDTLKNLIKELTYKAIINTNAYNDKPVYYSLLNLLDTLNSDDLEKIDNVYDVNKIRKKLIRGNKGGSIEDPYKDNPHLQKIFALYKSHGDSSLVDKHKKMLLSSPLRVIKTNTPPEAINVLNNHVDKLNLNDNIEPLKTTDLRGCGVCGNKDNNANYYVNDKHEEDIMCDKCLNSNKKTKNHNSKRNCNFLPIKDSTNEVHKKEYNNQITNQILSDPNYKVETSLEKFKKSIPKHVNHDEMIKAYGRGHGAFTPDIDKLTTIYGLIEHSPKPTINSHLKANAYAHAIKYLKGKDISSPKYFSHEDFTDFNSLKNAIENNPGGLTKFIL
jgi:hypothetical protein